ncbi:beta-galactosidase-like isoform X2 [Wyeomyia smithii]|nr:beta-galactosidase-like isoform X2 [Wyeomyia smithii]XP_055523430.1 beta-galactosidase-like isoform X2 [Wyeomyia smithii]XP_055523431.1 beta-galactosidase-like isoform X2 [Wyeomyia smithii]XP_055523432.1 beta-galactosidase-like isoform X2 [Wyeomyia smithii]
MSQLIYTLLLLLLVVATFGKTRACNETCSFTVDYEHDTFLLDGKPFRFVSGSFHYFRALPGSWRHILRSMRAAGLNVVMTYIEWSTHEPKEGIYNWDGIANLEQFIRIAEEENLYVILRPGPYICAERDMGGFPYWLLTKYPNMKLRTSDADYLREVEKWYGVLMPRIKKHLRGQGGPVIMVSIENEYGSFSACDHRYLSFLKNLTESYVQNDAVLFTNDGPELLKCGRIPGVLATLDFGAVDNPDLYWQMLRKYQPRGPLMNAEYYPGWLTHWTEPMARVPVGPVADTLRTMLSSGASVNFYMFFGGTNFGFTAGANDGGPGKFQADITSYDYDAPLDEAGDPTSKYYTLRSVILEYFSDPDVPVPPRLPKMSLPSVKLNRYGSLMSNEARQALGYYTVFSERTVSFEALNQHSGFVLYEATIPSDSNRNALLLKVQGLRDRAYVHIDNKFIGVLSRDTATDSMSVKLGQSKRLQLLVENQGRINYNIANDFKGILGFVTLGGNEILNWTMTGFPLDEYSLLQNYVDRYSGYDVETSRNAAARIFQGTFVIHSQPIHDTYVDPTGWEKGLIFINGFNLGRYWPVAGPQVTLYVPRHILREGINTILVIEYQQEIQGDAIIAFTDQPKLDGLLPFNNFLIQK